MGLCAAGGLHACSSAGTNYSVPGAVTEAPLATAPSAAAAGCPWCTVAPTACTARCRPWRRCWDTAHRMRAAARCARGAGMCWLLYWHALQCRTCRLQAASPDPRACLPTLPALPAAHPTPPHPCPHQHARMHADHPASQVGQQRVPGQHVCKGAATRGAAGDSGGGGGTQGQLVAAQIPLFLYSLTG